MGVDRVLNVRTTDLAGVAQWAECQPSNQRSLVWFPVRTHAWVEGLAPSWGHTRGKSHWYFSPSLFSSLSLSPKINKIFLKMLWLQWNACCSQRKISNRNKTIFPEELLKYIESIDSCMRYIEDSGGNRQ